MPWNDSVRPLSEGRSTQRERAGRPEPQLEPTAESEASDRWHSRGVTDPRTPVPQPAPGDPHTSGDPAPSASTANPPQCATRTRQYRSGEVVAEGFPAERISDLLGADDDSVIWLDLDDPTAEDLQIVVQEFGLHPLAVEDAVHDHQRPKIDRYGSHLFANVYAVRVDDDEVVTAEISMFVTPRALITVRKSEFDVDTLISRWDLDAQLGRDATVSFLLYGLLDAIVDGHYAAIEMLEAGADDLVASILDANLTEQSNQLNEITKKLASWAAIIAVPTAITGFYGQNVPYPGFGSHAGFASSVLVMVMLAAGVYLLLRRKGWL